MNIKYKIILATPVVLSILLSACDTSAASAQRFQEFGGNDASGVSRTVSQSSDICPTPFPEGSGQAVVSAADPEESVSAEHPEGIPSPAERDDILGGVNLGFDQPVEQKEVTSPGSGSETILPSSRGGVSPDVDLGKVNLGIDQEEDESSTGMGFFASILAFLQQVFGSTSISSATEQAQVELTPCP